MTASVSEDTALAAGATTPSFAQDDTLVWINGALVPAGEAAVSVQDHGLVVGDGVFESCKILKDGTVFALERHIARMARSAAGTGLQPVDAALFRRAAKEVVAANIDRVPFCGYDHLRVTYTGGISPMGSARGYREPTFIVAVTPGEAPAPATKIITLPWARNEKGAVAGLKTTSYAENAMGLERAHRAGATEGIFSNTEGLLCEGTGSNIFVVVDGVLQTPPLSSGCLAGVTRGLLLDWYDGPTEVKDLPMDVLATADEVFITSSTRDVQPVNQVDDRVLPAPGPVTRAAQQAFAAGSAADPDPAI